MTPTLPKSQGLEDSGALSKKRNKPKSRKTTPKTQVTPSSVPTEDSEKTQPVFSRQTGTTTDPKDSWGNDLSVDKGLPSTIPDEGTSKIQPLSEGPHGDKDSEGLKPPADMKPSTNPVLALSGIDAKYQVDQTQSTRFRYWSLTKNKGETSSEVESDTQTLLLATVVDVQALLLSDDELMEEIKDDVFVGIKRLHDDLEVTAAKEIQDLFKWDQQVVSELVALRNFAKKKLLLHSRSVCYKEMDQDSAHMVAASKVHMLKPGEYELWRMRMEQYIQMIDYSL
ncbi:hypothetical protein Tco_0320663 [Tanacetum coccineum]